MQNLIRLCPMIASLTLALLTRAVFATSPPTRTAFAYEFRWANGG